MDPQEIIEQTRQGLELLAVSLKGDFTSIPESEVSKRIRVEKEALIKFDRQHFLFMLEVLGKL